MGIEKERDRPELDEVKLTPEAVAAGIAALERWYGGSQEMEHFKRRAVEDVFRAVAKAMCNDRS